MSASDILRAMTATTPRVALGVAVAFVAVARPWSVPGPARVSPQGERAPASWAAVASFRPEECAILRRATDAASPGGLFGGRLRLAGTFTVHNDASASPLRRAIIDDIRTRRQVLVGEGDAIGEAIVRRIERDLVVVSLGGRDEELRLSFAGDRAGAGAPSAAPASPSDDEPAIEVTRYGKRVGENKWVLRRQDILGYYQELLDDPERIAQLYASFKPEYDGKGGIAGYRLGIEGEAGFLKDMGMREGDRIRAVNSLNMTSQSRAEYFVGEFIQDRLSAAVIDIERDGKTQKLIYLLR